MWLFRVLRCRSGFVTEALQGDVVKCENPGTVIAGTSGRVTFLYVFDEAITAENGKDRVYLLEVWLN